MLKFKGFLRWKKEKCPFCGGWGAAGVTRTCVIPAQLAQSKSLPLCSFWGKSHARDLLMSVSSRGGLIHPFFCDYVQQVLLVWRLLESLTRNMLAISSSRAEGLWLAETLTASMHTWTLCNRLLYLSQWAPAGPTLKPKRSL